MDSETTKMQKRLVFDDIKELVDRLEECDLEVIRLTDLVHARRALQRTNTRPA